MDGEYRPNSTTMTDRTGAVTKGIFPVVNYSSSDKFLNHAKFEAFPDDKLNVAKNDDYCL